MPSLSQEPLLLLVLWITFAEVGNSVLYSLGKIEPSKEAVPEAVRFLESSSVGEQMAAAWAVGRMGTRERANPLPMASLQGSN